MAVKGFPLLRHFIAKLVEKVGQFMREQIIWGVLVAGISSVAFTAVHLGSSWGNIAENLFALLCSGLWVVCMFVLIAVCTTARTLWTEGALPSEDRKAVILTDAEDKPESIAYFRIRLLLICFVLMTACAISGLFCALFAYRTALAPQLGHDGMADLADSFTVQIVDTQQPEPSPVATGFWIAHQYVVTCGDKIRQYKLKGSLQAAIPLPSFLGQHTTMVGGFGYIKTITAFNDEKSGIAVLRLALDPFKDVHFGVAGNQPKLAIPRLWAKAFPRNGADAASAIFESKSMAPNNRMHMISLNSQFGTVARVDIGTRSMQYLAYLSGVHFTATDCGAVVIDDRGEVIGMLDGESDGYSTAIPAKYIRDALAHVDLTY